MTSPRRPLAAGGSLLSALVALSAAAMTVVCLASWDVIAAAWWTLVLLVGVVTWLLSRARSRRHR